MTNNLKAQVEILTANLDAVQHLRNLDYPRRAGTEGDHKAAAYIDQVLRDHGLETTTQTFHFEKRKVLPRLILPVILLAWTMLSLANVRYWGNNLIVSLAVLALPLALVLLVLNMKQFVRYSFGRRRKKLAQVETKLAKETLRADQVITSQNVIAEIGPDGAEKQILFTAHMDSISSKLPSMVSMFCMLLGLIGFLSYSIVYLLHVIRGPFLHLDFPFWTGLALTTLVLLEISFVSRMFKGNASHGIIDDGTGVAILLELAQYVQEHPIPGIKFTFGFFGAEEAGLIGSAYYYLRRADSKVKPHVISIDMIGEKPPLAYVKEISVGRLRMGEAFNEQIASIAESLEIEIKGKKFPYPGSDFGHFMIGGGCTTNWLINKSRVIHSRKDRLGNVNQDLVNDALRLVVAYLSRLG